MKYALLIYSDPAARAESGRSRVSGEQEVPVAEGAIADWVDYTRALNDSGALLAAEQLFDTDTATTVRHRGERLVIDGPFAETKEHLLGFYLIDVPDLDTAQEWAARMPLIGFGSVEVRPVRSGMHWQAVLNE